MSTITPDMTMGAIVAAYPGARRALFRRYHIGGCSQCAFSDDETLAELCARNEGISPEEVAAYLCDAEAEDRNYLIEPVELKALLDSGNPPRILDIRSREEFEAVRIPGSDFFTNDLMQSALAEWDRSASIVLVDHDGRRGLDAAAFFTGHQFTHVKALRGGIDAYSAEADPSLPRYDLE